MDVKFSGLSAGAAPFDVDSLVCVAEDDGAGNFTSVKVTLTQLKDIVYQMEAEDEIVFVSTGTNKKFMSDSVGSQAIWVDNTDDSISLTADGTDTFTEGFVTASNVEARIGFNDGTGGLLTCTNTDFALEFGTNLIQGNTTGLGFFAATPVAKPTVTGSRGGNAALADLLTDLASLGLITDSTSA